MPLTRDEDIKALLEGVRTIGVAPHRHNGVDDAVDGNAVGGDCTGDRID